MPQSFVRYMSTAYHSIALHTLWQEEGSVKQI